MWGTDSSVIFVVKVNNMYHNYDCLFFFFLAAGPSRRADLEILGYCLLQWACGRLPWEDNLQDKAKVAAMKIK